MARSVQITSTKLTELKRRIKSLTTFTELDLDEQPTFIAVRAQFLGPKEAGEVDTLLSNLNFQLDEHLSNHFQYVTKDRLYWPVAGCKVGGITINVLKETIPDHVY
jgi:hypothetical protein